jgi:hypothetical protein
VLLFFQVSFQYDIPKKENDQCKAKLNALIIARTCEIEDNDHFQIFSIPVIRKKDGKELKLKFNTRAQLLVVYGKRIDKKELKITITPTEFILSIEDQDYGNLENDDSCFAFLTFIKTLILLDHSDLALQKEPQREGLLTLPHEMLLQGANSDVDKFYYYYIKKIENGQKIKTNALLREGKVNLSTLNEIQIYDSNTKFSLTYYEEPEHFPKYLKYNIYLVVFDEKEEQTFGFFVNFRTSELFEAMKKRFSLHTSCSSWDSLNYYQQIDLQNNIVLHDLELNGGVGKLTFSNTNFVDQNNIRVSSFDIYDMKLQSDWLYLKGENQGKIVNKKYSVKISNYCFSYTFKSIETRLLNYYQTKAKKKIFYFWELSNDPTSLGFGLDSKLETVGEININLNHIDIRDRKYPFYLNYIQKGESNLMLNVMSIGNFPLTIYINNCESCFQTFDDFWRSKLNKANIAVVENKDKGKKKNKQKQI